MKASELIMELQEGINKHGDLPCTAWQYEEEHERSKEVSCVYPHVCNERLKSCFGKVESFHIS